MFGGVWGVQVYGLKGLGFSIVLVCGFGFIVPETLNACSTENVHSLYVGSEPPGWLG